MRAVFDLAALGERSLHIDCDVIQADGGTRTAAITGGFVAAYDACRWLRARGMIDNVPVSGSFAAVSVGLHGGIPVLDLDYVEDSGCDTDMNVVMTGKGGFVEVQGTAEGAPFSAKQMESMLQLASGGIRSLVSAQKHLSNCESAPNPGVQQRCKAARNLDNVEWIVLGHRAAERAWG